ncbi:MAG: ATP-binding protein [Patescibacteria group bacterium]
MPFSLDLINILILIVIILNSFLGLFIFLTKRENKVNQYFFIFSIAATLWGICMFLFRSYAGDEIGVFFSRILYVSAAIIPYSFLYFIGIFPVEKYSIPKKVLYILAIPFLYICYISLAPNYLIYGITIQQIGEPVINFNQRYHGIYAAYIISYFSVCYLLLFIKYIKFSGLERLQINYVIFGTLISTMIGVTTNLIMPYIHDFSLNWMGQIGIVVMVASISYSILRHKLFDMKVVATQFIVFILCTALFARVLFSNTRPDLIINISFFVITLIISFLLLKSVINEVEQRERLEILSFDLKQTNDKLAEANIQQESLIHFITHQIKGFLAKSRDIYSMVLEGDYGEIPDVLRPVMQEGLDSETKGVAVVKEILDSANLKKGTIQYHKSELDLKELVREVIQDQKKNAEIKNLSIEAEIGEGDFTMIGDSDQLTHVIRNIIDNSIKYTLEGGLTINLKQQDNSIIFTVKDTGVGVTTEDKASLFTAGGKGKNSIKINVESTGYGLFIVKQIVDAHNGKIRVESEGQGKGTTFTIEFPKK